MKRSPANAATIGVMVLRVGYGAALILAPERLGRRWLGEPSQAAPTQVPLRGLGTREIVFHIGVIAAALGGADLRPWLMGSIVGDLSDVAATVAGRRELPSGAASATFLVGGGSALISALLIAADR